MILSIALAIACSTIVNGYGGYGATDDGGLDDGNGRFAQEDLSIHPPLYINFFQKKKNSMGTNLFE